MAGEFVVEFDLNSRLKMQRLMTAQATFAEYYFLAMTDVTHAVASKAGERDYAPVGEHFGGTLRRGIRGFAETPYIGVIGVLKNVPYARRREYTFDGKHDRLGRFYPRDPKDIEKRKHIMYLHRAVHDSRMLIVSRFGIATTFAVREMNRI